MKNLRQRYRKIFHSDISTRLIKIDCIMYHYKSQMPNKRSHSQGTGFQITALLVLARTRFSLWETLGDGIEVLL